MKRIKSIIALVLVALSLCTLFGCGDNGGGSNAKKSDLETLKNNLQTTIDNLENVAYDKFYSTYDSEGTLIEDVGYDASGYFYYREYKAENKETTMVYVWVEDNVLTSTYYYKDKDMQTADRRYWVNSYSSYEDAMEEFYEYFKAASINSTFFYPNTPEEYSRYKSAYLLDFIYGQVEWSVESAENRWNYTINKNTVNDIDFDLNYVYGYADDDYSVVIKDGVLLSYEEDSHMKVNYNLSLDWTFEAPDLQYYFQYN